MYCYFRREKREAAMHSLSERLGVESIEGENNVKIWTFLLNSEPTSVVLRKYTNGHKKESTLLHVAMFLFS